MILRRRDRLRLALAVLLGPDVLASWGSGEQVAMQLRLDMERAHLRRGDHYWLVEPTAAVWIPQDFPAGRAESRLAIAPVGLKPGQRIMVLRWR